jgi:hypothetical protein
MGGPERHNPRTYKPSPAPVAWFVLIASKFLNAMKMARQGEGGRDWGWWRGLIVEI